jgi:Tol biopolymer transport system component
VTTGLGNFFGGGGVRWINEREVLYTGMDGTMPTLFAISANGNGQPRRMIHSLTAWNPVVAPDGKRVAFISEKSGMQEIWVSDIDGQNAKQVTHVGRSGNPSYMPDGKSIVYLTFGEHQHAWRISIEGAAPQQITQLPTSRATASPDGRWLLCRLRSKDPGVQLWRTALVPLDGSGPPRFFDVPRYGGRLVLQWHPSGKTFSYIDDKEGVANVWLQDIAGGEPRQATFFESGEIFSFDWSRDGRKLVLSRGEPTSDAVLIRNFR